MTIRKTCGNLSSWYRHVLFRVQIGTANPGSFNWNDFLRWPRFTRWKLYSSVAQQPAWSWNLIHWRSKGVPGMCTPSWFNFFHFHAVFGKNLAKQECIPVGCVPATHWPYARVCFQGGVCSWGGVFPRGVSALGGVFFLGGGWYPSMHWGRYPPPVNRITHTCKNITLAQLHLVYTQRLTPPSGKSWIHHCNNK